MAKMILWLSVIWLPFLMVYMNINETKAKKNIILGVTLPQEGREDPDVLKEVENFKKNEWLSVAVLTVLAAVLWFFTDEHAYMTPWMLWIVLCIVVPYVPYVLSNSRLKKLKAEKGWIQEKHVVRVDTSALPPENWFSPWLFVAPVLVCLVPVLFDKPMTVMYVISAVICATLWFGYRYLYRNKAEMVDSNAELTAVLTRVRRYNWGKMWLLTSLNHGFAKIGSTYAMALGKKINECIAKDREIVKELHTIQGGKWYGMGLSEHIGFNAWCEEGCKYPVVHSFEPGNKERLLVQVKGSNQATEGKFWTGRVLVLDSFLDPSCDEGELILTTAGSPKANFTVENPNKFISLSEKEGVVKPFAAKILKVKMDRKKFKAQDKTPEICIRSADGAAVVKIPVNTASSLGAGKKNEGIYYWCGRTLDPEEKVIRANIFDRSIAGGTDVMNYISIPAAEFTSKTDSKKGGFKVLKDYSRGMDAVKAYPQDIKFGKDAPKLTYRVKVPHKGKYEVRIFTNPSNPYSRDNEIVFGISANGGNMKKIDMIPEGFAVGDGNPYWSMGVLNNTRRTDVVLALEEGVNEINIYALDPNLVLQKIVIVEEGETTLRSYMGPKATFKW